MLKRSMLGVVILSLAVALWGCGSNRDSGGSTTGTGTGLGTDPTTGVAFVGAGTCISCHEGFSWSSEAVADYLTSKHVIHSSHNNAQSGAACLKCHDPIGDGSTLESLIDPANVPAEGLAAIGCENCHGPGGQHYGVSPIPDASPNYDTCGKCHNSDFDHNSHHPYADNLTENYKLSGHIDSITTAHATPDEIRARCARCHSDEGFREFAPDTVGMDSNQLKNALDTVAPLTNVSPVQCRTCHNPHSGSLRANETTTSVDDDGDPATPNVTKVSFSASFNLCTTCHMNFLTATWDVAAQKFSYVQKKTRTLTDGTGTVVDISLQHGGGLGGFVHFDDPDTPAVEGFNINAADDNACLYCHDQHGATKFEQTFAPAIAEEWGQTEGFHGDYKGPAFDHGCTPCHSSLGLAELAEGAPYAEAETEVGPIGCVACHDLQAKNADGTAFELGPRRTISNFAFDNARTIYAAAVAADPNTTETLQTVDGLGDNALCMTCHSGRESTASVDASIAASAGPYSFKNIHYLAAGATLFGNMAKGAAEFPGQSYASKFEHVASNDLCIECHSPHNGHLAIDVNHTAGAGTCNSCHTNITATPDAPSQTADAASEYALALQQVHDIRMNGSLADYDGNGVKEGIYYEVEGLKAKLEAALLTAGYIYKPDTYPYFFPVGTTEFIRANGAKFATGDELRAAYNLQFATKDPGSYAHNPAYTIEILYDSIQAVGGDVSTLTRDDAGHFAAADEPFRHWDEDGEVSTSCGRCHSSDGAKAYFANGTVTSADYTPYTKGISAGLACEACHTAPINTATGETRTVSSVTFPSGTVLDATTTPTFFANASPLCMDCHQGRESGKSIDSKTPGSDGTFRFVNIHYFAAAASVFGSEVNGGYEYAGKTYQGRNPFPTEHAGVGFNTCAGCHMVDLPDHTFKPDIANCTICHGAAADYKDLGLGVSTYFTNIETLKTQLAGLLVADGVTDSGNYPYFGNITTIDQLRAAYNLQVARKEPCGYIHNAVYIEQLLFDSIEAMGGTPSVARPTGF